MAWTSPKTWTASVVTVSDMNTHVRDNMNILKTNINDDGTLFHRVLDRQSSVQTFVSSSAEQTAYTYAVPANTIGSTKTLRLSLIGDVLQNTGSSGATESVRVRVKFGTTTIFDATVSDLQTSPNLGALALDVELTGGNTTAAQRAKGFLRLSAGVPNNAAGLAVSVTEGTNNGTFLHATHSNVTEDQTSSKNLVVTIKMGTASANFTTRVLSVYTELK